MIVFIENEEGNAHDLDITVEFANAEERKERLKPGANIRLPVGRHSSIILDEAPEGDRHLDVGVQHVGR